MPQVDEVRGARLKERRLAAGMSQEELATKSGTSKGMISLLENNERGARLGLVVALNLDKTLKGAGA